MFTIHFSQTCSARAAPAIQTLLFIAQMIISYISGTCSLRTHYLFTGFTETPGNVSAPLGSGSVDFNCSGSVSLAFLVNGENVSSLPLSRGITVTVGPEGDTVSGVLTVPVIEENNNTVVVCRLKSGELQSTSPLAVLTITDCKCLWTVSWEVSIAATQ